MNEAAALDALTDREAVAYWNILQFPVLVISDGKPERHRPIMDAILTRRGIPHQPGKRTVLATGELVPRLQFTPTR